MIFVVLLALAGQLAPPTRANPQSPPIAVPQTEQVPVLPRKLAKIYASGDGLSAATAFKVSSVGDEYELLHALNLELEVQALVMLKKPYDKMTVRDRRTGAIRDVWFDISRFFGRY